MKFDLKILLLGLFLFIACNDEYKIDEEFKNNYSTNYQMNIDYYPDFLINHFPKKTFGNRGILSFNRAAHDKLPTAYLPNILISKFKYDDSEYKKIKNEFVNKSITKFDSNSENLIILFRYFELEKDSNIKLDIMPIKLKKQLAENNIQYGKSYPIPFFRNYDTDVLKKANYGLSKDDVILVLESKSGKYMPDKFLSDKSHYLLPKEWKHGYSKGVALNDKKNRIIYWMILW
jgi:hypothetical protein